MHQHRSKMRAVYKGLLFLMVIVLTTFSNTTMAQQTKRMVRIARIKVDPTQLTAYNAALNEQMHSAIKMEPGVLSYTALADKKDPSSITILEIYADTAAYQSHILTPHFKKYKDTVKDMVKGLELVDVDVVGAAKKPGI